MSEAAFSRPPRGRGRGAGGTSTKAQPPAPSHTATSSALPLRPEDCGQGGGSQRQRPRPLQEPRQERLVDPAHDGAGVWGRGLSLTPRVRSKPTLPCPVTVRRGHGSRGQCLSAVSGQAAWARWLQGDLTASLIPPGSGGDRHCPAASHPLDLKPQGAEPGLGQGEKGVAGWGCHLLCVSQGLGRGHSWPTGPVTITGKRKLQGPVDSGASSSSQAFPIHSHPLCRLLQGASLASDVLQRRQSWSLESETRFLSTKPQGRTAREVLTRWQPRAVCEDQVTVLESRLCEAARVTWMFALSVWQRCHVGTKSRKAVALEPREGGLLPASRPCLMRICPTGPWPRRAGSRARGRTGPSDLPSTPAPASCLGVGQFVLHRACLQSQGDKTFVCNPGKRKLCGRRQPLGSRPPRGARSTGAASLRCQCKEIHPWLPAGRTPPRKNLSSSINRAF